MGKQNIVHLEVCSDSVRAAVNAQSAGAYRVELCRDLSIGGITPSAGEILEARRLLDIKLNVLVRPRGSDFVYSDIEFDTMREDIRYCGKIGCDGVVIGILNPDGTIDQMRMKELIDLAREFFMTVTFHRAIDESANLFEALDTVIDLGCDRVLTSGGAVSAWEGRFNIARMVEQTTGHNTSIMPGAGVNPDNIKAIVDQTNCREIHGSFQNSVDKIKQAINNIQ